MQPFEQVEGSLSRSHNGTGLGLPLTAAMMGLHDGSLEIESEISCGTTVTIRFPRERLVDAGAGGAQQKSFDVEADAEGDMAELRRYG